MSANPPFRIDGRKALVTGGASGIGEKTVRALHQAGASVVIADLNLEAAEALAADLGENATSIQVDLVDPDSVAHLFGSLDRLDILVNNAGIAHVGNVEETELEDWKRVFDLNVNGLFLATKYAFPLLLASGRGSIVNIASVAGLVAVGRRAAYSASKGAVIAFTRQLAGDYAKQVRVNCICPGTVHTPFVEGYLEKFHKLEKDEVRKQLHARQPVGRMGKPEEIAHLALYMCSDEAEYMQGAVVAIDGGWTAL